MPRSTLSPTLSLTSILHPWIAAMTVLAMAMQSGQGHKLVARRDPATVSRLSQHVGAVATPLPVQTSTKPQLRPQTASRQPTRIVLPSIQRAPRPQRQVMQQGQQQQSLPAWAEVYSRQVRSLPQGVTALHNLLRAVEHLLTKADNCGHHSGVMKAYLGLGLIDITSQAWKQRTAQLQEQQDKMPADQYKQEILEAELALSGCRFMRIEASNQLAKQLHILLDDEGYCPSLNLSALPAPHALGLGVPQLLHEGLGINLQNPVIRTEGPSTGTCNISWDEYTTLSADQSLCGDWQFCYWLGDATWVPAPFGKFSTNELAALLTPETILSSLAWGIWGRALVTAAQEQGLPVGTAQQQQQAAAAAQQRSGRAAAAAGMPEAMKALLEDSVAGKDFRARMRQFSAAVASVRNNIIKAPVPAHNASVQGN